MNEAPDRHETVRLLTPLLVIGVLGCDLLHSGCPSRIEEEATSQTKPMAASLSHERDEVTAPESTDIERLQGTWRLVSAYDDGVWTNLERPQTLSVTGNTFRFSLGNEYEATLNETSNPKRLRLATESPSSPQTISGIYRVDDNRLEIVTTNRDKDYPDSFETSDGNQRMQYVFRRSEDGGR